MLIVSETGAWLERKLANRIIITAGEVAKHSRELLTGA